MKVPLLDLKAQYNSIKTDLDRALLAVVESQVFINGPVVEEFERAIAQYLNAKYAVGLSSGTDALVIALMALDIKPGDEVITTTYTFFATAGSIARLGAKPVFVDICHDTFNIDPTQIEAKISPKTKAIIPVHLFGQPADMDPILALAKKHGLAVIEDGAQAIGAKYKGQCACTFGQIGTLSFFPSKNLGGLGDGGMATTNSDELYNKLKMLRNHGAHPKYYHKIIGGNFRLDALQAAGLKVKLPYLDRWSEARRNNARFYDRAFSGSLVVTPVIHASNTSIYNQYCVRVEKRDELLAFLKEKGVGSEVYYPVPMHLQECFAYLGHGKGDFPIAEEAADHTCALPIYPELSQEQKEYVAATILSFYK
ncbi:MAG: transcriptional regulator [Candidatus Raymondbacteria bacterium RifOxyA12_full_50_37]|uniref:Transcriptional regulator n=1 Tax=Candidatus Raymondbacteria bacterium RIFOXYD12_FULL_49_13 TaxID=1817890 RepID=A0A1F7F7V5_UNCRA|nr:MAG: transcriptional regulator [Candidatus Raymondbacteria bacterium RifOxyA12_full_50_37]OGJ85565.1 MAG: transcriptional regulator [Candidatus Raymondbacteria bacterium RIFOXYA2_FULL_49_16]OGJ92817.1 MAG: transcriptional regulator [Candidatus Raymondbacteria bacterium RifOxyB12_full_50_8]OGJ95068.1 MAG: transcriptional regulator [Candidatus Raymondbacteria bacterium RIFOXYC2_FULL_50_21]OGK02586.1 MAG: transcriptional regulator [Candidatus Raymondbacteria bacterium RIFOXYD12_FULL_49_13]OGP3